MHVDGIFALMEIIQVKDGKANDSRMHGFKFLIILRKASKRANDY